MKRLVQRRLLEAIVPGKPLRVWIPQCSTGQDAYSAAIWLIEAMGSHWREIPLCVFSTDSDEDSLSRARSGRYPPDAARGISRGRLGKFFIQDPHRIRVRPFVREACRFISHNLAHRPPFTRLDMIDSRETLAELPPQARGEVLQLFHSGLAEGGLLLDHTGAAANAPELFSLVGGGRFYAAKSVLAPRPLPAAGLDGRKVPGIDSLWRESEERLRILFSQAEDAILVLDSRTDLILEANKAAVGIYGWDLPDLLRMRGKDLLVAARSVRRAKTERRSGERLRLPHYRRKDGTFFPADASTSFLMLQGRPCTLLIVRDATQRLQIHSGREREEAQDAFVGDVVHELRSPIAVIRGSAETLRRGVRGRKARAALFDFIENHTARMAHLVDRLLDLSGADCLKRATNPSPILFAEVIWEIAAAFVPGAKRRGISLKIDVPADLTILADPADMPHIFGNLLDNAIKFTPRGGKLTITGRAKGREAVVSVKDTGKGIAPEDLNRIFERFYRSEKNRDAKGSGLGLAIVHSIVNANHGRVVAENNAEGGSIFHVTLPLAPRLRGSKC